MLSDVIIRALAATGLTIVVNANGITTHSVVMSVCIFLILECSLLFNNKIVYGLLTAIPFVSAALYVIIVNFPTKLIFLLSIALLSGFTCISLIMYSKLCEYKATLYKTRDDSKELEYTLRDKNRMLLSEQDQQVHLATLAERNRIAREIHDNVGHLLSRAILLLGAISTVNKDENLAPKLELLSNTLDESMEKMRSSVHDLRDDSIDLGKNFEEITSELKDYKLTFDLDIEENMPANIKLTLIGILKEAVTNIIKHSNGDCVSVILHKNYNFCTLSVSDNETIPSKVKDAIASDNYEGIGLYNIKNRATSIGGDACFYTDKGFTVFVRLPFKKE